jgi:hypothetical protein
VTCGEELRRRDHGNEAVAVALELEARSTARTSQ